jgi:hypothetical protein
VPFAPLVPLVPLPPPPTPVERGPTVDPLIRTYKPELVVQRSPFTGDVGATPCGKLKFARPVEDAAIVVLPLILTNVPETTRVF